jgi:hypothetical protein
MSQPQGPWPPSNDPYQQQPNPQQPAYGEQPSYEQQPYPQQPAYGEQPSYEQQPNPQQPAYGEQPSYEQQPYPHSGPPYPHSGPPHPQQPWPPQQYAAPPQSPPGWQPGWQPPAWPQQTAPPAPRRSRLPLVLGLGASVVALMVVISAIFIVRANNAAADVRLEAAGAATGNPFMDSVGTDSLDLAPPGTGNSLPAGGGTNKPASGKYSAGTPGLYGGTLNNATCDRDKMLTFLKANPDKGREWARIVGIDFADLDSFVAELTPVVLRADTAVTNHGFANGKATTLQAVLQAGTAVMVDKYGTPVVKCYCGNPLSAPAARAKPKYNGTPWTQWSPNTVVVVDRTTVVIEKFTLVDVKTNRPFERVRADASGARDKPVNALPTPNPSTTEPTASSKYTKEDAIKLFSERDQACSGVRYPWSDNPAKNVDIQGVPGQGDGVWVLTITHDQGVRVFVFTVNVPSKRITPGNELAAETARYCPGFDA